MVEVIVIPWCLVPFGYSTRTMPLRIGTIGFSWSMHAALSLPWLSLPGFEALILVEITHILTEW